MKHLSSPPCLLWDTSQRLEGPVTMDLVRASSVQLSHSAVSDSLWAHGLQHARPPCTSPTPRVYSNSCPLSQWCHPTISSCHPLLLPPSIFPSIRVFSNESVLHIRWPKYWSFSFNISPSNEYLGLISFRMDWLDLLASPRDSQESSPTLQFKSINSSVLSFLYRKLGPGPSRTLCSFEHLMFKKALCDWNLHPSMKYKDNPGSSVVKYKDHHPNKF